MITQTITLTPVSPGVTKYIQAIQGENKARTLEFLILDTSGQPLDLTGCTVAFYVDRRGNGVVQVSATITEDNTAKLSLPSGTCDVPGEWGCWVQVIKPDIFDLRVDNLIIRVQPCDIDDAGEASEEFGLLTQLITQAQQAIENANEAAEEASTTAAETATNVVSQQKAQPNGIATLDSNGKLVQKPTPSDIGAASISEINGINSQINANSLSSGSLIKWDGEKLANGVAVSSVVSPNLLINPGFWINQRNKTSYNTINQYTVDRWMLESGSVSTTSGNNGLNLSNASICQYIEGMEQLSGETLTFSAWIGGAKKSVTGVLSASAVSADGLSFSWTSTGYIKAEITGTGTLEWAKLELGSSATPYCPPDPAAELLKCQRYYYRIVQGNGTAFHAAVGGAQGQGANIYFPISLPVSMRVTPQLSYSGVQVWNGTTSGYVLNTIIIQASDSMNRLLTVTARGSGATGGALYTLLINSSNSAYLAFDAEITA